MYNRFSMFQQKQDPFPEYISEAIRDGKKYQLQQPENKILFESWLKYTEGIFSILSKHTNMYTYELQFLKSNIGIEKFSVYERYTILITELEIILKAYTNNM